MEKVYISTSILICFAMTGCSSVNISDEYSPYSLYESVVVVDDEGATNVDQKEFRRVVDGFAAKDISEEERDGLLFMREEEKLAHDAYIRLHEKWGKRVFENIAASELTHTETVAALLEKYNISDPATGTPGTFSNTDLQALYDELVAKGESSLVDAFTVGAMIEEVDILDLQEHIAQTDNDDIAFAYENLMRGSRNHLRAFVRNLTAEGEAYVPNYLDMETYADIVGSDIERGNGQEKRSGSGRDGSKRGLEK